MRSQTAAVMMSSLTLLSLSLVSLPANAVTPVPDASIQQLLSSIPAHATVLSDGSRQWVEDGVTMTLKVQEGSAVLSTSTAPIDGIQIEKGTVPGSDAKSGQERNFARASIVANYDAETSERLFGSEATARQGSASPSRRVLLEKLGMDQKAIDATGLDEPDARGGVVAPITHDYCQRQYHAAISGYGCMRRVAHTKRHSKRFAWTDKIDVSAVSTDGSWWDPQRVREIRAATYFERRSKLVAWSPRKQLKSGNCADYTVNSGFSYEGANIGQSVTFELCPERVNPIITGKANGSVWEGESDEDQYVATASVNQFTHPRNATTMAKFVYDLKW